MMTIVLADDHALVREGLRTVLTAEPSWAVVGEATDGVEAVEVVSKLQPNVLIVDLMLPRLSGLEVIARVKKRFPQTRIIALSMHANESYVLAAIRNGAQAYVLKEASRTEIVRAVGEVLASKLYLSPPLSEEALDAYAQKAGDTPLDLYDTLTEREREVLNLAAQGINTPTIAEQLGISPRTVETHRTRLMGKLGLHSQTELVRYAIGRGLIPIQE